MKLLAVDYGRKRIGLAVADTTVRIALPHSSIDGRNDVNRDARAVTDLASTEQIDEFVVGLPLNMDGTDSAQTELSRAFAAALARLSKKPVHLHDERLSTYAAGEALDAADVAHRKRRGLVDRIAAQKILQSYLDTRPGDQSG